MVIRLTNHQPPVANSICIGGGGLTWISIGSFGSFCAHFGRFVQFGHIMHKKLKWWVAAERSLLNGHETWIVAEKCISNLKKLLINS